MNYESITPDGFRYFNGGYLRREFVGSGNIIDLGIPETIPNQRIIIPQPIGYDEFLPQEHRRIKHLNNGTYYDMSVDGFRYFVNGYMVNSILNDLPIINRGIPESIPGVRIIVPLPVGFDEYLIKENRRIEHLNNGTYISYDPDLTRVFVNGQFMCEF
jgi:hypothetical protein